jgi:hypothetical protein
MLDKPEETYQLLATLNAAVPFDVELPPSLIVHLLAQHTAVPVNRRHSVSKVSYLGDEGGIACHIVPEESDNVLVVSLTHVRVHRSLPFSTAVFDYQKHRVKKLKKRNGK